MKNLLEIKKPSKCVVIFFCLFVCLCNLSCTLSITVE